MMDTGESAGIVRALAYRKVATSVRGHTGTSLEEQRTDIETYCQARGLPGPVDHAKIPGSAEGTELARLLASLHHGDVVIVSRIDRLSRAALIVKYVRQLREKGAALVSLAAHFDTRRPESDVLLSLLAGGWRGARGTGVD